MNFTKKTNTEKVNFEYERDPRSIFSLPRENDIINLINSMIAEILDSDFVSDFKENFTSNYEKETLLDNIFLEHFKDLEINLTRLYFQGAFNTLNAIFFVLEYFPTWVNQLESNQYKSFFSDLSFYFNNLIISFLSFAHFEKEKEEARIMGFNLEKLIIEIQNFSVYLKKNFNINPISAFSLDYYKTLSNFDVEELNEILKTLVEAKLEVEGVCFYHKVFQIEKLIYNPLKSFKSFSELGKIYV